MTKEPPESETAGQTGIWHGGEVVSSKACLSDSTKLTVAASKLRAYVLDAGLVMVEARFGEVRHG